MKYKVKLEKYINFSLISNCIIFNTLAGCNKNQEGKKNCSGKPENKVENNNSNNNSNNNNNNGNNGNNNGNNNNNNNGNNGNNNDKPKEEEKPKIPEDPFKDLREQLSTKLNNVNNNNNLLGINKLEINIKSEEIQTATENRLKEIQSELDKLDKEITNKLNNDENGKKLLLSNKINQVKNLFDEVENLNKQLVAKGGGEVKLCIEKSQIEGNENVDVLNFYDQELNKNKKEINEKIQIEDKRSEVNNLFSKANNLNNSLPNDKKISLEISEGMIKSAYKLGTLKDHENKLKEKINDINNTKKAIEEENKKKAQELKDLQDKLNSSKPEDYIKNAIDNINNIWLKYDLNSINDEYKKYQESIEELNKNVKEKNEKTKELDNLRNIEQKIQNDKEKLKNLYKGYSLFTEEDRTIDNMNSILENVKNYDNKVVELKEKYKKENMDEIRSKYNTEHFKNNNLTGIFVSYLFNETSRINFLESAFKDLKEWINDQSRITKHDCPYKEIKEISDLLSKAKAKDTSKKEFRDTDDISDDDVIKIKEAQIKYLDEEKEKLKKSNDLFYFLHHGTNFNVDTFMKIEDFTDKSNKDFIDYFHTFINKEKSMIKMIHYFFPRKWHYKFNVGFYNKGDKKINNEVEKILTKLETKGEITEDDYKILENGSKDVKYNDDMIFMIKQYIEDGKFIAENIKEYDKDYNDLYNLGKLNDAGKHTQDQINNDITEIKKLTKEIDDTNTENPNLDAQIIKLKNEIYDLDFAIDNSSYEDIKKKYNNLITEINDKYKDNEEFKKIKDTFNEKIKPIA